MERSVARATAAFVEPDAPETALAELAELAAKVRVLSRSTAVAVFEIEAAERHRLRAVAGEGAESGRTRPELERLAAAVARSGERLRVARGAVTAAREAGGAPGDVGAFLGEPLAVGGRPVGVLALEGGAEGYDDAVIAPLEPLVRLSALLLALVVERRRSRALARRLEESRVRAQTLCELAGDFGYDVTVERDGSVRLRWLTGDFQALTGYEAEDTEPAQWRSFIHPADQARVGNPVTGELEAGEIRGDVRIMRKDGRLRWVEVHQRTTRVGPDGGLRLIGILRDVTERVSRASEHRRLEEYVRRSQRVEALGAIAGGLAHDFNNLLHVVLGNADLALRRLPPGSPERRNLEEIVAVARRGVDLTQKVLAYRHPERAGGRFAELGGVVREAVTLLGAVLERGRSIQLVGDDLRRRIAMPRTDLHQLVVHLLGHACRTSADGGRILVRVGAAGEPASAGEEEPPRGGAAACALLTISSRDAASPARGAARRLEPGASAAADMGLAVAAAIARANGGEIECEEVPGAGASFRLRLPVAAESNDGALPADAGGRRRARILFIDDDPEVARLGEELLGSLGYAVDAATESARALAAFRASPESYDLVLTDQTMPDVSGEDLVRELRSTRPDIPIILCSGYYDRIEPEALAELSVAACLPKPFDLETLRRVVHQALEASGGAS